MDFLSYLLTYKNVRVGPQFVLYAEDVYEVMMAAVLLYIHINYAVFLRQDRCAFPWKIYMNCQKSLGSYLGD